MRQIDAEYDHIGLTSNDSGAKHACELLWAIEGKISELASASVLALGADLIVKIDDRDGGEDVLQTYRATLAAIRLQLIGTIAEAVDRALAEGEEARP